MRPSLLRSRYLVRSVISLCFSQKSIDSVVRDILVAVIDEGVEPIAVPRHHPSDPLGLGQLAFGDHPQERPRPHAEIARCAFGPQQTRWIGDLILRFGWPTPRLRSQARKPNPGSAPIRWQNSSPTKAS